MKLDPFEDNGGVHKEEEDGFAENLSTIFLLGFAAEGGLAIGLRITCVAFDGGMCGFAKA
jgi:hypothetical protein